MSIGVAAAGGSAGGMAMAMGGALAAGKKGPAAAGAKGGPQAAKNPLSATGPKANGKPGAAQAKGAQGMDFGRDGAVSRGQGFSQRDTFQAGAKGNQAARMPQLQAQQQQPAQQPKDPAAVNKQDATQRNQAAQPQAQQAQNQPNPADATKREVQEFEAQVQRILDEANRVGMQRAMMLQGMLIGPEDEKELLRQMYKRFIEWLKEMDAIFMSPSPG